jgi:ankyrin repeat protein
MKYVKTFELYHEYNIHDVGTRGGAPNNKKQLLAYIEAGGDVDIRNGIGGDTPLIRASRNGKTDIVDILINAGADLNMHNKKGETALIEAASRPYMNIVYKLIEAGAQWNIKKYKDKNNDRFLELTGRTVHKSTARHYTEIDFFDTLTPKYQEILKEKYPEKYAKYLAKKEYS